MRYPDAVPLQTTTSKDVANALLQIFSRLSVPLEILTDRGANFISDFMKEVYKFMGIRHIKTAPYRPQSNGCLEHFHHLLMQMVRECIDEDIDWDIALPYFLFACHYAVSSSIGLHLSSYCMERMFTDLWMYSVISGCLRQRPRNQS